MSVLKKVECIACYNKPYMVIACYKSQKQTYVKVSSNYFSVHRMFLSITEYSILGT